MNKPTKNCLQCGQLFEKSVTVSKVNWEKRSKFCSKVCMNLYRKGKPSASPNTTFKKGHELGKRYGRDIPPPTGSANCKWKGGQVEKTCLICKASFKIDQYRADSANYCRKECADQAKIGLRFSPATEFKTKYGLRNLATIKKRIRKCQRYIRWRKQIFVRDGYRCVTCLKQGTIHADHYPKPFADILASIIEVSGRKNLYKNAMNSKELWDINNGRTLCKGCHYKTPNYGAKQYQKVEIINK